MINVTKTFLPPLEEYSKKLELLWQNKWLTNNGVLFKEFTSKLKSFLDIEYVIPMTNGTLPIQIALNSFGKGGEIITTPFSYVATTSSIVWENCTPVFVDIHPEFLTIDETKIEAAINEKTTAILATHVYGNPCEVEAIQRIAGKYGLKVIYDAAHCFAVTYKGQSIFNYGDVSTCSFHATKLFHTAEGGALFCKDEALFEEMWYKHNFGHNGQEAFHGIGINAKMSEIQAAMGLCVLPYMDLILNERQRVVNYYNANLNFNNFRKIKIRENTSWNYSYYPIVFNSEIELLKIKEQLEKNDIYPRRYFYPSLENLPYINGNSCPIANKIASKVLCLPLYVELQQTEQDQIIEILNQN